MANNQESPSIFMQRVEEARRKAAESEAPPTVEGTPSAPQKSIFLQRVEEQRKTQPGYVPPPPERPGAWVSQETLRKYEPVVAPVSGAVRGLVGAPGVFGDIQSLYHRGAAYAMSKLGQGDQEEIFKRLEAPGLFRLPKSQDLISSAEQAVPVIEPITKFEPETRLGRIAQGTAQAAAPGAIPGRVGAIASLSPGGYGQRVLTGAGAGAGGETLGEATKGGEYETGARIAGSVLGGLAGSGAGAALRARGAPAVEERAQRIAGEVLREGFPSPQAVERGLQKLSEESAQRMAGKPQYVQDVAPSTRQIVREPGLGDVEREVMKFPAAESQAARLAQQQNLSREALSSQAQRAKEMIEASIPQIDLKAAFSFPGPNPQNIASQNVRRTVDAIEQSMDAAQKAAWANTSLKGTNFYTQKTVGSINDYVQNLDLTKQRAINPNITSTIKSYLESGKKTIPMDDLQSMRSAILDDAREAIRKGRTSDWFVNNELAKHIKGVMEQQSNIQFGANKAQAVQAWKDAVAATKQYYDTFRPDFMKKMVDETKGGAPVVSGDAVFDEMFKGSKAAQNFDAAYRVIGPGLADDASTWILGKLTDNGRNLALKQSDVNKFLSNPQNAAIVSKIPGLEQRMNNLVIKAGESAQQATLRNVNDAFQTAISSDNPRKLADFLEKNSSALKLNLPSEGQNFIDSLQRSARLLQQTPVGAAPTDKIMKMLSNNTIGGILYGRALGKIPDAIAGEFLTFMLGKMSDIPISGAGALLATTTRQGQEVSAGLSSKLTNLMFGPTKDETVKLLSRAMNEPELAMLLMQKPAAANIDGVLDALGKTGMAAGRAGAAIAPVMEKQIERSENRQQRRVGGRVMSAQHMLAAAERAKKDISGKTKVLLNSSDDHVAKALEIAKQNLDG